MRAHRNRQCLIHIKHKKLLMFIIIEAFHLYLNNFLEILYLEAINEFLKLEHSSLENFYWIVVKNLSICS